MTLNNTEIALAFQRHIGAGELDSAFALAADDATFIGPDGATNDKAGMLALFTMVVNEMAAGPFDQTVTGVTTEGERVAVQMIGSLPLKNGRTYNNRYHFLFIIRDGQIVEMTEYCDTKAAAIAFAP